MSSFNNLFLLPGVDRKGKLKNQTKTNQNKPKQETKVSKHSPTHTSINKHFLAHT